MPGGNELLLPVWASGIIWLVFHCSHNTYVGQDLTQGDASADHLGALCSSPFQVSVLQILAAMDPLNFDFSPLFGKNTS